MASPETTEGPRLFRPIPRRPFKVDTTPPSEEPTITAHDLRFLDRGGRSASNFRDSCALTREDSLMNLTAPTLYSIYSPIRDVDDPQVEPASPWGLGSETPVRGRAPSLDRQSVERDSRIPQRKLSAPGTADVRPSPAPSNSTWRSSLAFRALLLFGLGMGYGALVTQLPSKQNLRAFGVDNLAGAGLRWEYLAFWGAAGVALGSLLPWIDGLWERTTKRQAGRKESGTEADWALVVRGIGCFVGIVFAIRRLPWASTFQVSMTLALANPFLWYLIDRSKAGLLFSAVIGILGSAVMLGLSPDMMPAPMGPQWDAMSNFTGNFTAAGYDFEVALDAIISEPAQGLVETGMWVVSVLFCSSICFGNIGRRLALSSSAVGSGRWGGIR